MDFVSKRQSDASSATNAQGRSSLPSELAVLLIADPNYCARVRAELAAEHPVLSAASFSEALMLLEAREIGVVMVRDDVRESAIQFLAGVATRWPDVQRLLLSRDATSLCTALRRGYAHDYALDPCSVDELCECLRRLHTTAARRRALPERSPPNAECAAADEGSKRLVGLDGGLKRVGELARRVAASPATVLIQGETGTGKELVARFIHDHSARAKGPFVALNCAALPEGLLESELFGHEQGAFTGAQRARKGRFELAHGGTLFLDEIGDISPRLQVALLRVLQERRLERLGATSSLQLDVRIVTATHRDLRKLVCDGAFREDLYYRLSVVPLHIPALRERRQDLEALLHHFIDKWSAAMHRSAPRVGAGLLPALAAHSWPGNVRELENFVQRALVLTESDELNVHAFSGAELAPVPAQSIRNELKLAEVERLRELLRAHGGNVTRAARDLGIPRTTLVSRAKRANLL